MSSAVEHELDIGRAIWAVAFTSDGKYLLSGGHQGVQKWRLQDGYQCSNLRAENVLCVAVSKDGRWIGAMTLSGDAFVWDAETQKKVFPKSNTTNRKWHESYSVAECVNFSPDSTRFMVAAGDGKTTIWAIATWTAACTLEHDDRVKLVAAKYSPRGDRIATATRDSVLFWDGNSGDLLVRLPVSVDSRRNRSLSWCGDYLFVTCNGKIIKLDASTMSTVSEWTALVSDSSCIAAPRHGKLVACSTKDAVTIWDALVHIELAVVNHSQDIRSICFSPDGQFIAIGGASGRIVWKHLSTVLETTVLIDSSTPAPLLREWVKSILMRNSWKDALAILVDLVTSTFALCRAICDYLETCNNVTDAVKCFHQLNNDMVSEITENTERTRWVADFRERCLEKLPSLGDAAMSAQRPDEAIANYSAALSLKAPPQGILIKRSQAYMAKGSWEEALDDANQVNEHDPLSPWNHESVLIEWAKVKLVGGSWKNALSNASTFKVPRLTIYKILCERLEVVNRITEATECLRAMISELEQEIESKETEQIPTFKSRSYPKLENQGDAAMSAERYEEATSLYTIALGLDPPSPQTLFVKRSKAHAAIGKWEDALDDANEAITLDPMSLVGYEQKYSVLRGTGRYQDALYAFETLLVKMSESPSVDIRERCRQYKNTRTIIRRVVQDAIRELPRVLINTATGSLCDKTQQAAAFESLPIFTDLISSSMQTDHASIEKEVTKYYRYAMLSHKWEDFEPLFEKVIHVSVYDLEVFPTHDKLRTFCKTVREAGFHWAWSDTCCINKADHFVLQEALVSMFTWYRGSSLTIVFLRGVSSPSGHGDLVHSIWNSRIWTFQEYHASRVVRFYGEDWTLYRNIDVPNHKESPEIISEMEEATSVSAQSLTMLQPGLDRIREKLCLASQRETTVPEDAAYALFGIFTVSLPVVYGERDHALGRLLARLLTSAGDTSILAWTGRSGSFNSCLPAGIIVFGELSTTHIPLPVAGTEIRDLSTRLQLGTSQVHVTSIMKLYDRLYELPVPSFTDNRMKLPCICFPVGRISATRVGSQRVFHVRTATFGTVQIQTTENLARFDSLILVHPWIDFLLDQRPVEDNEDVAQSPSSESFSTIPSPTDVSRPEFSANSSCESLSSAQKSQDATVSVSNLSVASKDPEALQLLARLRQPFGALLLAPTRRNVVEYRRVAAGCVIKVQIREDASLDDLCANVRTLDVL